MKKPTLTYDCPQKWENMKKIEGSNNRICGNCQTELVDFTKMSTIEIQDFFKQENIGCGKFYNYQLENTRKNIFEKILIKVDTFFQKRNFILKSTILWLLGGLFFFTGCYRQYTAGTYAYKKKGDNHIKVSNEINTIKNQ